jgi:hypothetical protein
MTRVKILYRNSGVNLLTCCGKLGRFRALGIFFLQNRMLQHLKNEVIKFDSNGEGTNNFY